MDTRNSQHDSPINLADDEHLLPAEPPASVGNGTAGPSAVPFTPVHAASTVPADTPLISPKSFATRIGKSGMPQDTRKMIWIGTALAAAVAFFLFTTFSTHTTAKRPVAPGNSSAQTSKPAVSDQATSIPMMDPMQKKTEDTAGRVSPSDIERTRGQGDPLKQLASAGTPAGVAAGTRAGAANPANPGKPLSSVPSFNDTQQKWEEPPPYGTPDGGAGDGGAEPAAVRQEERRVDRGLAEASLLYVRAVNRGGLNEITGANGGGKDASLALREGTRIEARLVTQISSSIHAPVIAVVENTYAIGDQVLVPAGSRIYGKLTQVDATGNVGVEFNQIELVDGVRNQITAVGTGLDLGPIKGKVEGRNNGRNFLVRAGSGITSTATALVGSNSGGAFSQNDQIRERAAENIGTAGDAEISSLNANTHIIVSVPANTKIYVMWTERAANTEKEKQTVGVAAAPVSPAH